MGVLLYSPWGRALFPVLLSALMAGCGENRSGYGTFADYPGFEEHYSETCTKKSIPVPPEERERHLLDLYRPRFVLPPGGRYPIDFYRDYLPFAAMRRHSDHATLHENVTSDFLDKNREKPDVYLDFKKNRFADAGLDIIAGAEAPPPGRNPTVYGRAYRERVDFPCPGRDTCSRSLTFLKYNITFALSGLAADLPFGYETVLRLVGLDPGDWHELDNFVAVHVVLDEREEPRAVLLAQHNHHRTYLVERDIPLPPDRRMSFDIALRSNEVYPSSDSEEPVRHRAVRWPLFMKYLISGEDPPLMRGYDLTMGIRAGGAEIPYELALLSPCDPFYTAKIMLGEPRNFLGRYIGRDGPPGADYYTIPALLPLGDLLQFSYLRDGAPEDIRVLEEAIDIKEGTMDVERIREHGGGSLYRDLFGGLEGRVSGN
jgi:hypothetical protein